MFRSAPAAPFARRTRPRPYKPSVYVNETYVEEPVDYSWLADVDPRTLGRVVMWAAIGFVALAFLVLLGICAVAALGVAAFNSLPAPAPAHTFPPFPTIPPVPTLPLFP
jgi:hypothetical protein